MRRRHLLVRMLGASVLFALWIVVRFHWSDQFSTIGVYGLLTPVIFFTAWVAGLTPSLWLTSLFLIAQFWFFVPHPMGVGRLLNAVVFGVAAVVGNVLIGSRRVVVRELQSSEERYRTMVETAQEGVWLLDPAARTEFANPALLRMLGTDTASMMRRPLADYLETPGRGEWERTLAACDAAGRSHTELRFRCDDGGLLWADFSLARLSSKQGAHLGYAALLSDVTKRQQTQERKALLLDIMDLLTSSLDFDETLQNFAHALVPLLGDWCSLDLVANGRLERRAVVHHNDTLVMQGYSLAQRYGSDSAEAARYRRFIDGREPVLIEDLAGPGARERYGVVVSELATDLGMRSAMLLPLHVGDHAVGIITLALGPGERRYGEGEATLAHDLASQASLALRNAELYGQTREQAARITTMLSQLQEGVVVVDQAGKVVYGNPALDALIGRDLAGAQIFGAAEQPAQLFAPLVTALRQRQGVPNHELTLHNPKGERVVVLCSAVPIVEGQEVLGAVATLWDITERKQVEEQKDQFISIASHELRTPVTSLKLNAQGLLRQARKRGAAAGEVEGLESISRQSDRLVRLVRNLLDVSRLEHGQLAINVRPLGLAAYLADVLERLQQMAPERTIRLAGDLEVQVLADSDRIEQVLINLMSNALQHSPADTPITLTVTREHGRVVLGLRDEGEGIERTKQAHLFERFYQAHSGPSMGAGLGLNIAKQIVLQHHGTIWVSSEPGGGSTFFFSIPTAAAKSAADRPNVRIKR